MFVTSQDGNVYLLQDTDSDGRADSQRTFSSGYYFPLVDDLPFDVHMNNNLIERELDHSIW